VCQITSLPHFPDSYRVPLGTTMGIFLKKMPMPVLGRLLSHPENALITLAYSRRWLYGEGAS